MHWRDATEDGGSLHDPSVASTSVSLSTAAAAAALVAIKGSEHVDHGRQAGQDAPPELLRDAPPGRDALAEAAPQASRHPLLRGYPPLRWPAPAATTPQASRHPLLLGCPPCRRTQQQHPRFSSAVHLASGRPQLQPIGIRPHS
jgi:hypothetical protein